MDIKTGKFLAEYNKRTNIEMNRFIKSLHNDQWNREFGGYFNSIKSLCNHIYVCDFNWLKRFSNLRQYEYIQNPVFDNENQFGTTVIQEIESYLNNRAELDEIIIRFVHEISQSDLEQVLMYTDSHKVQYRRLFGGLVLHMFNHQTHHRGMISLYLEYLNIENDFSNIYDML